MTKQARNSSDELQLITAIIDGNQSKAASLIKAGFDTNVKDKHDNTALHYSLLGGYHTISKLLLASRE